MRPLLTKTGMATIATQVQDIGPSWDNLGQGYQTGNTNTSLQIQSGNGHTSFVTQVGNLNMAIVTQGN